MNYRLLLSLLKSLQLKKLEQVLSDDQRPSFEENGVATFLPQKGPIHGICKVPNDTFQHIFISKHKILVRGLYNPMMLDLSKKIVLGKATDFYQIGIFGKSCVKILYSRAHSQILVFHVLSIKNPWATHQGVRFPCLKITDI